MNSPAPSSSMSPAKWKHCRPWPRGLVMRERLVAIARNLQPCLFELQGDKG